MDKTPGALMANPRVPRSAPAPRLKLLIELEPRHREFFRNLADLLLLRHVPQIRITARPAPFWKDVFVPTGLPWSSFFESMLWHLMLVVLFVLAQSRVWTPVKRFLPQDAFHRSATYYQPLTFRSSESRVQPPHSETRAKQTSVSHPAVHRESPRQAPIRVTRENKQGIVTPPDLKKAIAKPPNLPGSRAITPMMPLSATGNLRQNTSVTTSGVVAPSPQLEQTAVAQTGAGRLTLPQASVVAPAPEIGGPSTGRLMESPYTAGMRVVPPPPAVQGAGKSSRAARQNSLSGGRSDVVPPPPSVRGAGSGAGAVRLSTLGNSEAPVVPPPPAVGRAGASAGNRGMDGFSGAGSQVVPPPPAVGTGNSSPSERLSAWSGATPNVILPPPSVQGTGNGTGAGRLNSVSGTGSQVVPPPPSVQRAGGSGGRMNGLARGGSQVVPPPPSLPGAGDSGGGGRRGSLSGGEANVISPPPSVSGAGNSGGGRLGSMADTGSQVVPPPPTVLGEGNGAGGNRASGFSGVGSSGSGVVPPSPSVEGTGNSSSRVGSLSGDGSQVVPPPPTVEGSGRSGGGTRLASLSGAGVGDGIGPPVASLGRGGYPGTGGSGKALEPLPLDASSIPEIQTPAVKTENKATFEELPLGVLGLVFAARGGSYFSNFEVFVAKRRVGKDQLQLIKLVYEFLPYQRRLSEYDLNNLPPRVIKLRVTPDPSCDETLGDIVQPPADPDRPVAQYPKLPSALLTSDLNAILPCYRTNAEDFRLAMSHR